MGIRRRGTPKGNEFAELGIYFRTSKEALNKNQADNCNTRTRLKKTGQLGLLKMLDFSGCLDYRQITSVDHETLKGAVSPLNIDSFIEFHQSNLTKVHPAGWLANNYDPISMWQAGAQVATLNLDTEDKEVQVNNAMFRDTNGGCGYVLKPDSLLTSQESSCVITIKILEGRHLKTLKNSNEQLTSPNIVVMFAFTLFNNDLADNVLTETLPR